MTRMVSPDMSANPDTTLNDADTIWYCQLNYAFGNKRSLIFSILFTFTSKSLATLHHVLGFFYHYCKNRKRDAGSLIKVNKSVYIA